METVEPRHARRSQVETLRAAGLRITGPRLAILRLLQHDTNHPTAEQVFRRLRSRYPSLSLATVYNTLTAFARRGLCRRVPPFEGPQRFDGMLDPHHHALCTGCGRLFDVPVEVYGLPPPPAELGDGLSVHGVQLTFQVLCASCQAEAAGGGDRGKADRTVQPTHEEV